jgi:hypothetical protein
MVEFGGRLGLGEKEKKWGNGVIGRPAVVLCRGGDGGEWWWNGVWWWFLD